MSIITILMVIWFFKRSRRLKETRDIEKYVYYIQAKSKIEMDT